jgi:hypothetical protein
MESLNGSMQRNVILCSVTERPMSRDDNEHCLCIIDYYWAQSYVA